MAYEKLSGPSPGHRPSGKATDLQSPTTASGHTSYPFPQELIDAMAELNQVHEALRNLFGRPSAPVEAENADGKRPGQAGQPSPRPLSHRTAPAMTDVSRLRARASDLVGQITAHPFWTELHPSDVLAAWETLKADREEVWGRM